MTRFEEQRRRWREEPGALEEILARVRARAYTVEDENLSGADLSGRDLCGLALPHFVLDGAILDGADLDGAVLQFAKLREASLKNVRARRLDATQVDISDANLTGADLRDARLSHAVADRACLRGAVLDGADLDAASLRHADLTGSLEGAKLGWADITGATLPPIPRDPGTEAMSSEAIAWLWAAGWRAERRVDVAADVGVLREHGYAVPAPGVEFLEKFGGLVVGVLRYSHELSADAACRHADPGTVGRYAQTLGPLVPVGTLVAGQFVLLMDAGGALYRAAAGSSSGSGDDDVELLGDSYATGLDALLRGGVPVLEDR